MNTTKFAVVFAAVLVCGMILPSSLQAQQAIEDGTIDVAGSIGLNSGVDLTRLLPDSITNPVRQKAQNGMLARAGVTRSGLTC